MSSEFSAKTSGSPDGQNEELQAAQIRLLYENATTGTAVTIIAAPVLAYFQSAVIDRPVILAWLIYMMLVCAARFLLSHRYWHASQSRPHLGAWGAAFAFGAGLAGAGWGMAGILLFPNAELM